MKELTGDTEDCQAQTVFSCTDSCHQSGDQMER